MGNLASLSTGARAVLGEPKAADVDATVLRLIEMGMTRGAEIVVVRRAPLGDPIEIMLRGTRLCLRKADALRFPIVDDKDDDA